MSTIYYDIECDFTQIPNHIILNPEISGTAKAIYFYIIMRIRQNKEWEFYDYDIMSHLKEGRDAFRNAKKELIEYGYLIKIKQNIGGNGKYKGCEYAIKKEPITGNPTSVEPTTDKPTSENQSTNNNKQSNNINNKQSKKDITTASGFSSQSNYSEIPNSSVSANNAHTQTSYQGNLDNSTCKEILQVQKQDGQQDYILNTSKKSGQTCRSTVAVKPCILDKNNAINGVDIEGPALDHPRRKNADFDQFWKEWCNMCKTKGSTAGEKKPAQTEYQKAVKFASHQGIMRTLEAFKGYILLAFESNKHACRWLKNIHWSDFEEAINNYKQQTEVLKAEAKKQGKPLPVQQKSPEKQQEEVKMKEHKQKKREGVLKALNGDEVQFMNHIKEALKPYFSELHKPWIDDFVFSCRNKVAYFGFTEQKHIDTVKRNFVKFKQIIMREITSTVLVKEGETLNIELKLID